MKKIINRYKYILAQNAKGFASCMHYLRRFLDSRYEFPFVQGILPHSQLELAVYFFFLGKSLTTLKSILSQNICHSSLQHYFET